MSSNASGATSMTGLRPLGRRTSSRQPKALIAAGLLATALGLLAATPFHPAIGAVRESAPREATWLRAQGYDAPTAAAELARSGIDLPLAVARVLAAADYVPEDIDRVLTARYRLARTEAIETVRRALFEHGEIAGTAPLRRTLCYASDGRLLACPVAESTAPTSSDPAVAALARQVDLIAAAAHDTIARQQFRIRDLERVQATSPPPTAGGSVTGDRIALVGGSDHLTTHGARLDLTGTSLHQTVQQNHLMETKGSRHLTVGNEHRMRAASRTIVESGTELLLKSGATLVLESDMQISLKVGGNFITIDNTGIWLVGNSIRNNQGGSAGSIGAAAPLRPDVPLLPAP
ncbi:MAG: hypothetical protein KF911_01775 [Pseudomonadales bacterium]|nr:hypothetical protein [Pseudomonadales bacterium]